MADRRKILMEIGRIPVNRREVAATLRVERGDDWGKNRRDARWRRQCELEKGSEALIAVKMEVSRRSHVKSREKGWRRRRGNWPYSPIKLMFRVQSYYILYIFSIFFPLNWNYKCYYRPKFSLILISTSY